MNQPDDPASLTELLERLRANTEGQVQVSVGDVLAAVGERSFGPMVLIAGVITLAPLIGDIPGVPTLLGLMVLLTLGQLIFQRHSIWIPSKLARRNIEREKLARGLDWMNKPAIQAPNGLTDQVGINADHLTLLNHEIRRIIVPAQGDVAVAIAWGGKTENEREHQSRSAQGGRQRTRVQQL